MRFFPFAGLSFPKYRVWEGEMGIEESPVSSGIVVPSISERMDSDLCKVGRDLLM